MGNVSANVAHESVIESEHRLHENRELGAVKRRFYGQVRGRPIIVVFANGGRPLYRVTAMEAFNVSTKVFYALCASLVYISSIVIFFFTFLLRVSSCFFSFNSCTSIAPKRLRLVAAEIE